MINSTTKYNKQKTQVVILGAGPGGYSAAFRCADLGIQTTIIEKHSTLGGVCLNVGCIPSKTLLDIAKTINNINKLHTYGIISEKATYNINQIRLWKEKIINEITKKLNTLAKTRHINIIHGYGTFVDSNNINVNNKNENIEINFEHAIIAAGSHPTRFSYLPHDDQRIWNSTDALSLKMIPEQLLIIGAGAIGLEMATIYHAFGSTIDIIELQNKPISNIDEDIIKLFLKYTKSKFNLNLETKVKAIQPDKKGIYVTIENKKSTHKKRYDAVLIATGRTPNGKLLNAEQIKINIDTHGFIKVDNQMRTSIPNIFAIGDIVGPPMLAHKSIHEGHIAAEVISGMNRYFDPKVIPSIIYTEPEIAWAGFTENNAKEQNINYETANFPWIASGRAASSNAKEGVTKLIFDKTTHRIIGGTVLGKNASELLGEICLAIEMGCEAEDIALTIHAHPSLNETIGLSAAIYTGSITDLPNVKSKINQILHL